MISAGNDRRMAWYWAIMGVSAGSDMGGEWRRGLEESRSEGISAECGKVRFSSFAMSSHHSLHPAERLHQLCHLRSAFRHFLVPAELEGALELFQPG